MGVPTEHIVFDLIFSRLRLSVPISIPTFPRASLPKPRSTVFCYMRSSALSSLWPSPGDMAHLLAPPHHLPNGGKAAARVLANTLEIQATLFLISNFWHLCYGLAPTDLRGDRHSRKHHDTFALLPLSIQVQFTLSEWKQSDLSGRKTFPFFPCFCGWSNNEIGLKQINRRKNKFHFICMGPPKI